MRDILEEKLRTSSAILAMNVQSIQQISIVSEIASMLNREIIIQFSAKYIPFLDNMIGLRTIVEKYKSNNNIFFHLDHCQDINLIKKCVDSGFDSVMFDGSSLYINENIKRTKEVVSFAHSKKVLVEGEVGIVGGVEDDLVKGSSTIFNPEDAINFYNNTNVDLIALGIGNAHGVYESTSNVNIDLLGDFQSRLTEKAFLVLHGATGLQDFQLQKSVTYGVVKINYSTEFKIIYQQTIKELAIRQLHDEIYFYDELSRRLQPAIITIINKISNVLNN